MIDIRGEENSNGIYLMLINNSIAYIHSQISTTVLHFNKRNFTLSTDYTEMIKFGGGVLIQSNYFYMIVGC